MSVRFKLYATNGSTLIYTFHCVFSANYPHSEKNLIEHTNPRAKGSIIVDGGSSPWTLNLKGVIFSSTYDNLMNLVDNMESYVTLNTPFVLGITSGATTHTYNVKRTEPIIWQEDNLRTNYIEYNITFRVNCWG
jgi:hypothetical protein